MKLKRILSSALAVIMTLTAVLAVIPATAFAAHSESSTVGGANLSAAEVKKIVLDSYEYDFANAEEMLNYEREKGYLDRASSAGNQYTIYVNRYTGLVYYVNNLTGQILTSNPYNAGYGDLAASENTRKELMSQIRVTFSSVSASAETVIYNSSVWAGEYAQISTSLISGGIRVNYTLGDTSTRFLTPGQVPADRFEEYILTPMLVRYGEMLAEYLADKELPEGTVLDFFAGDEWTAGKNTYTSMKNEHFNPDGVRNYCKYTLEVYQKVLGKYSTEKKALDKIRNDIMKMSMTYQLNNPINETSQTKLNSMYEVAPLTKEGKAVYVFTGKGVTDERAFSVIIRTYCPEYTFQMLYEDEQTCGYVYEQIQKPVFRCSLEYTFNSDGSLSVRLPATSISFDETAYTLKNIASMMYFGAGDLTTAGYVFVPDGSGSIIEFDDFYNSNDKENVDVNLGIYGKDYCYSKLTGAHLEQVVMPVYGIVSGSTQGQSYVDNFGTDKATTGFFAILEEGASLANVKVSFGGKTSKFANAYTAFTPYPSDEYDLSDTISVGASGSYTIVSESKYTGSYVTRYVMLSDPALDTNNYDAGYVGMATYYRNYLVDKGEIERLTEDEVYEDLPLYVEALGSMEIVKKVLTFPVTTTIPLTTFDDVGVMYDELSDAKNKLLEKAAEYDAMAEAEVKDLILKEKYTETADRYRALSEKVVNITNVNFKLTGFANGGMYYTYPSRVKWEKACGGKGGFNDLVEKTATDTGLKLYPEFDFQYVSNTAMFDGISNRKNISRMVDNRYASKQEFNSAIGEFVTAFAMVVSPDTLADLFAKFDKSYSKYEVKSLSASTLGSDLNSNFDEDNPINRNDAMNYVTDLLDDMVNKNGYSVLTSKGNIYSVKHVDHIIEFCTDSSHLRYSSYTIPFTGMILHGYVNYAGNALNYSGLPDYDILRSIENGASLYYMLCYQNTNYMKEDFVLNKYYGVDYDTWYDSLVETYSDLNATIGDYQRYHIVDHTVLYAERIIDEDEVEDNNRHLVAEFVEQIRDQLDSLINATYDGLYDSGAALGTKIKLTVDDAALIAQASSVLNLDAEQLAFYGLTDAVAQIKSSYETKYSGGATQVEVSFASVDYATKYKYVTDSFAQDKDYFRTDYTVANNLVTMVTYEDPDTGDTVRFILNYNIYGVTVALDAEHVYNVEKYGFVRVD